LDVLERLPAESNRVGAFLRRTLPFLYRAYHEQLGQESVYLHDVVALAAVLEPEHFEFTEMAGDVETRGELTLGATVFDRRPNPRWRRNMDVAMKMDSAKVFDCVLNSLALAGSATE
jgi:purine nucleosidase